MKLIVNQIDMNARHGNNYPSLSQQRDPPDIGSGWLVPQLARGTPNSTLDRRELWNWYSIKKSHMSRTSLIYKLLKSILPLLV